MTEVRYILSFKGLPEGDFQEVFTLSGDFLTTIEGFDILGGEVKVEAEGSRCGDNFEVDFVLSGKIQTPCDRCNTPLTVSLDAVFPVDFSFGESTKEVADNVFVVSRNEPEFVLDELFWQWVVLAIPMRKVHPEGACSEAVEDFFRKQQRDTKDARWASLEQIEFDK